jgi:NAD(P) transhydrogenase subunit alpha
MIIAVPRETADGEQRVALVPSAAAALIKQKHEIRVEKGAGLPSGFTDAEYTDAGATIVEDRGSLINNAEVIAQVRTAGASNHGTDDLGAMKSGQTVIGFCEPLIAADPIKAFAEKGITLLSMELIPRITRAQAMDALSSQANLAGYKAVIRACDLLSKIYPMMITAAGTIKPAKVFIVGAGVAGLQAIATAKRLGAAVSAIDVRPEVKEQVESLGARFVMPPVQASGEGGYAKELTPEQKAEQQKMMADTVADSDVVITTALIPGRPAPKLVTTAMVESMRPGSVIVDLAAERGGNCESTEPGKTIEKNGVTIVGSLNGPSEVAHDASTMYAGNVVKLLQHLVGKGNTTIQWNMEDEITKGIVVCREGQIVHARVRQALGL